MPTVLITGANRGIGLEFAQQYAADGWRVIACCREPAKADELNALRAKHPGRVAVERLDVLDHATVDALAARYRGTPIDVLINNAGIIGPRREETYLQHFGTMDYGQLEQVLRTNTVAPLKVSESFADHVASSDQKKIVTITSSVGSIVERKIPNMSYASSKAAVNKIMTLVAEVLRPRGVTVLLLCPGNINQNQVERPVSIAAMKKLIAAAALEQTGTFTRYNGERVAF